MKDIEYDPAFPETRWDDKTRQEVQWTGMTLRDYFAAKVLQADFEPSTLPDDFEVIAARAYSMADEMLKARQK